MLKNSKLSTKLFLGFGLCIFVILALTLNTVIQVQKLGKLQDGGFTLSQHADASVNAEYIGEVAYSIIADAVINRNLEATQKLWDESKPVYAKQLKDLESIVDTDTEKEALKKAIADFDEMSSHFETKMMPLLRESATASGDSTNVAKEKEYQAKISEIDTEIDPHKAGIRENLNIISESLVKESEEGNNVFDSTRNSIFLISIILSVSGIIIALFIAILIAVSVTKSIKIVADNLAESSDQVLSASNQVSQSGQSLAESASEQASSLEEISSSLEEMTSMTKQNTDNTKQADTMANEALKAAEKGIEAMNRMSGAIEKINASSIETAKIIKTIDEIAFQTNLLALNAAVEAARAGEAGMGFAVVADEVRNLARRSAEAAKITTTLIEESKSNSQNGVAVSKEVAVILSEIAQSAKKVKQLVSEVSAASEEQSQGISQVNVAVIQMDKVTQTSAANAEESASASEELSSQAQEMNGIVITLKSIVEGSGNMAKGHSAYSGNTVKKTVRAAKPNSFARKALTAPKKTAQKVSAGKSNDVIPFDDDFEEF